MVQLGVLTPLTDKSNNDNYTLLYRTEEKASSFARLNHRHLMGKHKNESGDILVTTMRKAMGLQL